VTRERARSRRTTLVAIGSAVVLVLAGVALALAFSRNGGSASPAASGAGVLPTAPASAPVRPATRPAATTIGASGPWPVGLTAWTVVLASVSHAGHPRAALERSARATSLPGLRAQVLDSSQHPRLRPALWIVFAGRYATRAQAERSARRLRRAGSHHAVPERLQG
jgi:hypothetical protein